MFAQKTKLNNVGAISNRPFKNKQTCHPERSEGSEIFGENENFLKKTSLRLADSSRCSE